MSNKQFNSVDGYSVGANGTISVVDANGNVSTNYLTVTTEANLGNVANITITGGSPNYVLSTDGAGNLSWVEQTGGGGNGTAIANGNSNVNIPTANGNVNISSAGNANILVVTGTGANIAGTLNATGNANVGNLSATAVVATTLGGALTTSAQPNITSVGTLTSLAVSGNVTAANFVGNLANGNSDIAIPAANGNINFDVAGNANVLVVTGTGINVAGTLNATGNANVGNLTASRLTGTLTTVSNAQPNITSVGTLTGLSLSTNADISLSGTASQITGANRVSASFLTGTLTTSAQPNITSVGTLSSLGVTGNITSGNANLGNLVTANYFQGDGSLLTNIPIGTTLSNGNSNVNIPTANGNINISAVGNANIVVVTGTGANIDGYANITGNLSAGNISTTRLTGTLTAASNAQPNITSVGTLTGLTLSTNADISLSGTGSRVTGANLVSASFLTGTITTSAQPNITSVGTLTNVSVTGNVAAGNLTTTGVLTVTGSGQSNFSGNLNADNITAANGIFGATGTFTGNVSGSNIAGSGNLSVTGSGNVGGNLTVGSGSNGSIIGANLISANYFQGDGSLLTNIPIGTSLSNGNSNVSIPAANGNVNISAVGNANVVVVTGTGANINGTLNATGNANVGNLGATGVLATTLGGTLTTAAQPNITSVGTLTSLAATGNVIAGNVYANSGTIGAQTLRGEGGNISNIQGGNVSGAVATATSATTAGTVTTAAQPNITSVGTLTSLSVTGTATAGNLSTGGNLSVSGNAVIGGNLTVDGNLVYVNVDTLAVEDPIINLQTGPNGAAPVANSGKDVGTALNYYDTQARIAFMGWDVSNSEFGLASQASISSEVVTFTAYGNLRVGNIIGNGQALTGLAGANVTGQVANALVAGTVYTAAQPNITSVGTLSSLAVTGDATAGNVYANSGTIGASLLSGTLTTAAQPNITSIGTLTSLSATGNITSGNANLGNLVTANFFQGDGSLLTNIPIGTSLSNGNSNVSIPTANGNVNISAVGNANVVVVTGTGINVAGTLNATGNANVGNIGATRGVFTNLTGEGGNISNIQGANVTGTVSSATTAGTVTTNAQPNITSVGTLSSLAVTGNANIGNLGTAQVLATANVTTPQFISNVATGTAPIVVASTTKVANLNADTVDGYDTDISNTANTIAVRDANGNVSANYFIGNGSQLTGIITSVSNVSNGNSNLDIPAAGGNVTVSVAGNANILTVTGTGVNVSGTLNATGNANVGNLSATGVLATTLGGTLTTAAQPNITSVGTLSSLTATGNVISGNVYANSGTIGASLLAGTLTTAAQPNITSVGTLAGLNVSGNAQFTGQVVNLGSNGNVKINGGSSGQVLSTDGSGNLSWVSTGTANTANTAQTVTNNAQPNITSVGTLTSLEVTGNIISGNVYANSGRIGASLLTGTLTTSAQPNITSVGTLASLSVTGNLSSGNANLGNLAVANYFQGDGSLLTNIPVGTSLSNGNSNVSIPAANGNVNISAAGNANIFVVTGTGVVVGGNITPNANITYDLGTDTNRFKDLYLANSTIYIGSQTISANATSIVMSGNLVANVSGNIIGSLANGNSSVSIPAANGNVNISAVGNTSLVVTGTGANIAGTLNASGNANVGNLGATEVIASLLTGTLTTAAQPNITSIGTLSSATVTGNIIAGNVYANSGTVGAQTLKGEGGNISNIQGANVSGAVTSATTAGTVTTAAQPNITSVGTLSSIAVTGNANVGNLNTDGLIAANGNISGGNLTTVGVLTVSGTGTSSIAGNLDMTSNSIINLATPTNPTDAATKQYVDDVAQGLHTHDACQAATPDTLANITGGTITYNNGSSGVGANLVTTGSFNLIDGVNVQTAGTRILIKNEANSAHNGIYVWSNATVITRATDFDTPAEMAGGDFTFVQAGTLYDNTGWVMPDTVTTVGTSPVTWVQFSGAGTYTAGTGLTLTGTQFSVNTAQPTITSVGTLTGLGVNGNITAGNIIANTGVFSGNGSGLSQLAGANVTGQVANALVAGTVYTAAQPNITSVGTLTGLDVSGNTTAGNVYANSGTIGASLLTGTLTTASQPNITSVGTLASLNVSGNANTGNIGATRGVFTTVIGEGGNISNIQGANVSGTVATATTAGTVTTAAQPNITSVGTLTSLTVSGASNLGPVGNVTITGGTNGQVLTTNGSGGLSWTTVSGGGGGGASIANGTSNVNIPAANGNVNISAAGNANVLVVTGTGANITGIANINGNLIANNFTTGSGTGGNITGANVIFANTFVGMLANGNSDIAIPAANGNINFDVAGNANVVVITGTGANIAGTLNATGNANVGNLGTATAVITTGNITTINSGLMQNGNSNIAITANANVTISAVGGARITATSSGANVTGTLGVSSNISAANSITTAYTIASVTTSISAAGTVQSNATALTTQFNVVSTVNTGAGVRLPTAVAGMRITITNTSANSLNVYPATNGRINSLAANAAYSHATAVSIDYIATTTTQWYTL